jgi:hypothetical protein
MLELSTTPITVMRDIGVQMRIEKVFLGLQKRSIPG